jgi:hypothetical protein
MTFDYLKEILPIFSGFRTRRKIVVIESDDWGSIRMPSRATFARLSKAGLDMGPADSIRFNLYDTLEGANDLEALFGVLKRHKDHKRNSPVITALSLVSNPDFELIRKSNYQKFHYESMRTTQAKYYPKEDVWAGWKFGISERLFVPEFHGREHLNVNLWMRDLRAGDKEARLAFDSEMWGFTNKNAFGISYQAAYDFEDPKELMQQENIIADGLRLFDNLFGYSASFFVPPNGCLSESLYVFLMSLGLRFQFSSRKHSVPIGRGVYKTRYNYLGKRNAAGQLFITRNAVFEPSLGGRDWVGSCLREIENAFRWKSPAIISTHRVNYVGALDESNREDGLIELDRLLGKIVHLWPEVEFLTSVELGELLDKNH